MTYIMYIDETYNSDKQYTILGAFIIPSDKWKYLNESLNALKIELFSKKSFNLKSIRRHKHEPDGYLWTDLSQDKKNYFNERFWSLVSEKENTIIAALINKENMEIKNKLLNFKLAYGILLERFQYFLQEKEDVGFVIYDKAECEEVQELYDYHKQFIENGIPIKTNEGKDKSINLLNIFENLVSDDDETNNCLQIIDMIGAAISAKYNHNNEEWFSKFSSIIRHDSWSNIEGYGIKIFPENKSKS